MACRLRDFECAGCGGPVQKRAPADAEVRCIECAVKRSGAASLQIRAGQGEFYDRWVAGMRRAADKAAQRAEANRN